MRLGIHLLPQTLDQYLNELGGIANDPATLILFDTNILGYLYKLHAAARRQFFLWAVELDLGYGRLGIPAWSANEYLAKFKAGKFSEYAPSRPEQVLKALKNLRETASLFVDTESLQRIKYADSRDAFLNGFDEAIAGLEKFTRVFNQQFDTWSVHEEIRINLSSCVLRSPLGELCARAAAEGETRNSHRLPPGTKDSGKAENKYGDLIIWYELLREAKRWCSQPALQDGATTQGPYSVLFVTNDEKPDWVYAPDKRQVLVRGVTREAKNADPILKLPDPRLIAEFEAEVGNDRLRIVTLPMLVRALSVVRPKDLDILASAIQVEGEDEEGSPTEEPEAAVDVSAPTPTLAATVLATLPDIEIEAEAVAAIPAAGAAGVVPEYPPDALRDGAYEDDAPGKINEIIRALRSHNWYVQNPAFTAIKEIRHEQFEPRQWFVLGRNVYQAACGNAQKALEFVKNLDIELSRMPDDTATHFLSGMVYEIYFDSEGQFRRRPKISNLGRIMTTLAGDRFQASREFVQAQILPFADRVPFKPGTTETLPLEFQVDLIEGDPQEAGKHRFAVHSVRFLGIERLRDAEEAGALDTIGFTRWSSDETATVSEIKSELADNFAIPEWGIVATTNIADALHEKLKIPEGKILSLMRPRLPE